MESTFAQRVLAYRKSKQLSQAAFAEQCGLEQGNISQMEKGTEPKRDNVSRLLEGFPDLNPDWLLLGKGSMLRDGKSLSPLEAPALSPNRIIQQPTLVADAKEVSYLKERLQDKDTIIELLREQLEELRNFLPEQLKKFLPDSLAAEPRPTLGFVQRHVTMTCGANVYTQGRPEVLAIWKRKKAA